MAHSETHGEFFDVIMPLRHNFNNASLENEIQHLVANASTSDQFLIKMEIMNFSRDVHRVIDLRTFLKTAVKDSFTKE